MQLIPSAEQLTTEKDFVNLAPDLQALVLSRLAAMREIQTADCASRAIQVVCGRQKGVRGWGNGTVRNLHYLFKRNGDWRVLLDFARAGLKRNVDLSEDGLPKAFCQWLASQWSMRQRGKFRAAWVDLKAQYRRWREDGGLAGSPDAIPGYDRCPEPRPDTCLPNGWTEGNLRRLAKLLASRAARKLISQGPQAARIGFGYKVPSTRVGLEVGEVIIPDDCWNDFRMLWRGKGSRIISLHLLDLASGCNVLRGHKPTQEDERQVEERLKEADMIFLAGAYLFNFGYRPAGTTFLCERATSTLRKDEESCLDLITDGAVRVQRVNPGGGPGVAGLFTGPGGGNPNGKAPIESWFNLFHNRCDHLLEFPGQTGKNSRLDKPEGIELMERTDEAMLAAARFFTPDRQMRIRCNLLQFEEAAPAMDTRAEFCNTRRDHDCEGWRECGHVVPAFRLHNKMDFIPWSKTAGLKPDQMEHLQRLLASDPDLIGEVRLSPREVFDSGASRLKKFNLSQYSTFLSRVAGVERPVKNGIIAVNMPEVRQEEPVTFGPVMRDLQGREECLPRDAKFRVVANPYDPRGALLFDSADRCQGVALRQPGKVTRVNADPTSLQEHFKAASRVQSGFVQEARQLAAPLTARADEIATANAAEITAAKTEQQDLKAQADAALFGK